jgi:hypothetical protein
LKREERIELQCPEQVRAQRPAGSGVFKAGVSVHQLWRARGLVFIRPGRILASMPPVTQTDRSTGGRFIRSPLVLALLVTVVNAAKPVVVDDTAYLIFARQIAVHPLDPYGFTIFWYTIPEPAFEVLAPPVAPYWLALGLRLFGEEIALLKLWLFPFVWLFAWATNALLRRFAHDTRLLALIVFSPAVLPTVNLMLDIPALALGLAAVVIFTRASARGPWGLSITAGLLTALAMQTKYTMLLIPPVIGWHGLLHGRLRLALIAVAVAVVGFASWEWLLVEKYGRSHFLFHLEAQQTEAGTGQNRFAKILDEKANLAPGLAGHFGCLGIGVGLIALGALGMPRRGLWAGASFWVIGFAFIALAPAKWTTTVVSAYWETFGWLFLAAIVSCAALLVVRGWKIIPLRANADSVFVAGWFAIELAGYFALTPFPAARRVIGLTVVGGILVARAIHRVGQRAPARQPTGWLVALGIAAGVVVAAIDTLDAFPEKDCAERAAMLTSERPTGSMVWYAGHWGFQFYCERAGMRPVVPGESVLARGDYLVLPIHPNPLGFDRPYIGRIPIEPGEDVATPIGEMVWDDWLSARTVPNFYGGNDPIASRDHPRLRVVVYRIIRDWKAGQNQRR